MKRTKFNADSLMDKRNYGIDALRIYAMFLVVILHVLGQGGIFATAQGPQYAISWFMEVMAYCAVNCFAILSGYVSFTEEEKPYHYTKYISMWLQVVCYSFSITLMGFLLKPEAIGVKRLIKSLLPVTTNHYWYFSAYTGVFFLIPWLNKFVRSCSEKELNRCVLILFGVFSCYGTVASYFADAFKFSGGYSCIWLILLYICGAWMKKCHVPDKIKSSWAFAVIMLCAVITWCTKMFLPFGENLLISYLSPTIVLIAVCYVVIFSKLKIFRGGYRRGLSGAFLRLHLAFI